MGSLFWSQCHMIVFAGLLAIINAQCLSTNLLFSVEVNPSSTTVNALNDVTLTCLPRSPLIRPSGYTWFRINGDIPSSSSGQNTNTLTLNDIVPADEGEYYCIASLLRHCAKSENVMVSVRVSCPSLSNPSNGMINCLLRDDGAPSYEDTCSFTCDTGYELTGSESRTCQINGTWSGSIAMCIRASCPLLSEPSNGVINCSLGDDGVPSYEDTCSFTCNTGYELTGNESRTCQSDGSWSGSTAMCNRVSCPSLSDLSNGLINCSLGDDGVLSYEDTCSFTCNTGYELTGSESRTCQSDGSWSGSTAMCNKVSCPLPSEPNNGIIECTIENDRRPSYEDTCSFTCITGYELTGSDSSTCQSNGSWSGSIAICNRVSCPLLSDPSNGMINCSLGDDEVPSYEDTCSFTCNTGYELTGSESRICQSNGSWSGNNAVCDRVSCPSLSDPNNGIIVCSLGDDGVPSYEDTCSFTCNTGYELTGSENRTCQSDGSWTGSITMCNRVSCPSLSDPSNGMINCSLGDDGVPSYEDICNFTCNTGYELTGSESRTCQSDGSWSGSNAMCIKVLAIQFSNSTFSGLESSGIISVTLILEGGASASVITVTVQPFDQSPVSAQGNGVDYTSASITATFSVGSTSTTIDIPVSIDNTLEERETFNLNFSIPSSLSHPVIPGNITTATGIIIDDTNATVRFGQAMYTVDETDGVVEILLTLSNPSSTILLITVFALDESAEEGVDFDSGPYNVIFPPYTTTVSFNISIINDAILEQNETFTLNICPPDDFFVIDPDEAVVTIVDDEMPCSPLTTPSNGLISCSGDGDPSYGDTCNFTCDIGYELTGSESRTCQINGTWSGSIAMCNRISCSIKGQVHTVDCFGTNATCSNPNPPVLCDVPQCVCPKGQVIDEAKSACIGGAECRRGCDIKKITSKATYSNLRQRLTLTFSTNRQGNDANFQCKIDNQEFIDCSRKIVWRNLNLRPGRHTVTVSGRCIYNGGTTSTASSRKRFFVVL